MKIKHGLLGVVFFNLVACTFLERPSIAYDAPESVVYDPSSQTYFVSNYGGGNVFMYSEDHKPEQFLSELNKPLGLLLRDRVLYVVNDLNRVSGFSLNDGEKVLDVEIPEALFLNDITSGSQQELYVSDSQGSVIYRIDLQDQSYSQFRKTSFNDPNGIYYDAHAQLIVVCQFFDGAVIELIPTNQSLPTTIIHTEFDNLDGIARDSLGNYYFSAWGSGDFTNGFDKIGQIIRFDGQFLSSPKVILNGYQGPADIYFNLTKEELLIPLFFEQRVEHVLIDTQ